MEKQRAARVQDVTRLPCGRRGVAAFVIGLVGLWVSSAPLATAHPLREHEARVAMGTVVSYYDFRLRTDDALPCCPGTRIREVIPREYSMVTAPDFWWHAPWDEFPLRPSRDAYDFRVNDAVVAYIEALGLQVRGHALLHLRAASDSELPKWLTEGTWTRDQALGILREHILTVVGRYRGRITSWAVVNEPVRFDGLLWSNFWLRTIGPDYIELAFRWAHEADPDAILFWNDDAGEGINAQSDGIYALVRDLVQRGVPIHGVGLEMHLDSRYIATGGNTAQLPEGVRANIERLGALGLQVQITEMDVRIPSPPSPADLEAQARVYREMLEVCRSVVACTGFTTWGFSDRYSWIPASFPGLGAALPFDAEFNPKPAYFALHDALEAVPAPSSVVKPKRTSVSAGQTLVLDLTAANPPGRPPLDVYVGFLFPDGDTIAPLVGPGVFGEVGRATAPASVTPMLTLGGGAAVSTTVLQYTVPAEGIPVGTYRVFAAVFRHRSLMDNVLNEDDLVSLYYFPITYSP